MKKKIVIDSCENCPKSSDLISYYEQCIYAVSKGIPPECPLEDDKSDAVEFAEWLNSKYVTMYPKWISGNDILDSRAVGELHSTEQLYELFKNRK